MGSTRMPAIGPTAFRLALTAVAAGSAAIAVDARAPQDLTATKTIRCLSPACPGRIPAGGRSSFSLYVPEGTCGGLITDIDVGFFIRHPNRSAVEVSLRGPASSTRLFSGLDGSSDNLGNAGNDLIIDEEAVRDVEDGPCEREGDDRCYGRYRTNGKQLDRLNGSPVTGFWSLEINTGRQGGDGTIDHWQIEVTCAEAVASPTATLPRPSPTPVAPATAQPTPVPQPIFLPLARRDHCPMDYIYADVLLVFDMSTSMRERTPAGRAKYEAAIEGARGMVGKLRMQPGQDQVGIVSFNSSAQLLQPLTHDRGLVLQRLDQLTAVQSQSRIDLGIRMATTELLGPRRHGILSNMVLLSDGKSNPVPVSEAISAANDARRSSILSYVVALGPSFDDAALRSMATDSQRFFIAWAPEDVVSVYSGLWSDVLCSREAFWGASR